VSANVVCVGQLYAVEEANGPCGWTGARKTRQALGRRPTLPDPARPCPRCGGRVEVAEQP
jgi:hypothetical protein